MSTCQIADILGIKSENSVRQSLLHHDICLRSPRESVECNRRTDGFIYNYSTIPVIEGALLGDGSLRSWSRTVDSYPYFSKKNKHYNHISYVAKLLFGELWEDRIKSEYNNGFKCYILRSFSHRILKDMQDKWYPKSNGYKKLIPDDINISSELLLHWFMDDGNSYSRNRKYDNGWKQRKKQIVITLCTECFERENQEMISDRIKDKFGISFSVRKYNQGTGWRMYLPQSQADDFFDIIGKSPVESMEYKWK